MIESSFFAGFVYKQDPEKILPELTEKINEHDAFALSRRGTVEVSLRDTLSGCALGVKTQKNHVFNCSTDLLYFSIGCDRLTRPDGADRLDSILSFIRWVYTETEPTYVFGMLYRHIDLVGQDDLEYGISSPITDWRTTELATRRG